MVEQQEAAPTGDGFSARLVAADGTSYELSGEQTLGRSPDADITIVHPKISRNHARFSLTGRQLTVQDLDSANGTCVNQRRIAGIAVLCDGDVVSFDTIDLGVVLTGLTDAGDATVVNYPDDATVVNYADDATAVGLPRDLAPGASAARSQGTQAPARNTDLPGSWVDQPDGEYTQVLSGVEAAAHFNSGPTLTSTSGLPHLIVMMKSGAEQVLELEPAGGEQADVWEIGRDKNCQIAIPEESVSGRHAQLIHQNGRWRLVNLVSTNGIYVNGQKRLTAYLADGDEIKLGAAALLFRTGNASTTALDSSFGKMCGKPMLRIAVIVGVIAAGIGLWLFLR